MSNFVHAGVAGFELNQRVLLCCCIHTVTCALQFWVSADEQKIVLMQGEIGS